MSAISGSITGTTATGVLPAGNGDFYYRLNCSAYTSGTAVWNLGRTNDGLARLQLSGTWVATLDLQSSIDKGVTWIDTGESYTANTTEIVEQ